MTKSRYEYAGFWIRFVAVLIDSVFICMIMFGIFILISVIVNIQASNLPQTEETALIVADNIAFGTLAVCSLVPYFWLIFMIVCWIKWGGTPGKRLLKLKILDAKTGRNLTIGKAILRLIGYVASPVLLFLGYIWVVFDAKKQGWHDKIASTIVVRELD